MHATDTGTSVLTSTYRRRWGCEAAPQGARLRVARAFTVEGAHPAAGAAPPPQASDFDPRDHAAFAREAQPTLRGLPTGQDRW